MHYSYAATWQARNVQRESTKWSKFRSQSGKHNYWHVAKTFPPNCLSDQACRMGFPVEILSRCHFPSVVPPDQLRYRSYSRVSLVIWERPTGMPIHVQHVIKFCEISTLILHMAHTCHVTFACIIAQMVLCQTLFVQQKQVCVVQWVFVVQFGPDVRALSSH